jgi:hypothetical protein
MRDPLPGVPNPAGWCGMVSTSPSTDASHSSGSDFCLECTSGPLAARKKTLWCWYGYPKLFS